MNETSSANRVSSEPPKLPFYIVDPNLRNVVGHYFEYDRAVADGAASVDYETIILAHQDVEPTIASGVGAHRVFSRDIWGLANATSRLGRAVGKLRDNGRFLRELARAIRRFGLPPGSVIFAHTFIDRQFLALALLPIMLWSKRDVRYVYLLRYQPEFYLGPLSSVAFHLIEFLVRRSRAIYLTTDSERLAEQLGRLTVCPVHVLPIPHVPPEPPDPPPVVDDGTVTFVSLGNARDEKGMFEILDAIRLLHRRGQAGSLRFVLQCNDAAPDVREAIERFAALRLPNCELLFNKLESEQYYNILSNADIVLLPYWRSIYFGRTSGVFMEALSAGKPVIATEDTWMSDQLTEHGAGLLCRDRSAEVLAAQMLRSARNRDALARAAIENRTRWRETHNPTALIRAIDALVPTPPAAAATPQRILILYPHDDFVTRQGGASRRANLLADFLTSRQRTVRVLQGGATDRTVTRGLVVESLGREPPLVARRSATGLLVWLLSLGRGMKHRWMFWQYARIGATPRFRRHIRQLIRWSDIVVLEYPFWAQAVVPIAHQEGRKVVLSAHDVLADQLSDLPWLRAWAWRRELLAWQAADVLVAVSADDRAMMSGQGLDPVLAPNPTDGRLFEVERLGDARRILRDLYSVALPTQRFCLFVGSLFEPNVRAVDSIREIARTMETLADGRDVGFVIVGGCAPAGRDGNVLALGRVEDGVLLALYAACDLVLVPIPFGTGASLKTIEGMAAGKVVLGTAAAFRGLDVHSGREAVIEDAIGAYPDRILSLLNDAPTCQTIGRTARRLARYYDSRVAFLGYLDALGLPAGVPDPALMEHGAIDATLVEIARHALQRRQPDLARTLAREVLLSSPDDLDAEAVLLAGEDQPPCDAHPTCEPQPTEDFASSDADRPNDAVEPDDGRTVAYVPAPVPVKEWPSVRADTWERFHNRDFVAVIERAERLLKDDDANPELHFLLAQSLHNAGEDPARAEMHYTRAAVAGYSRYWVWVGRGRLHRECGRKARALRDLSLALGLQPFRRATPAVAREWVLALAGWRGRRRIVARDDADTASSDPADHPP